MPKKNVAHTNSGPTSSKPSDLNHTLEIFLLRAKKYLIPAASLIIILSFVLIVVAFMVNKKKEKVLEKMVKGIGRGEGELVRNVPWK